MNILIDIEAFHPVYTNQNFTDMFNETWTQITVKGWQRNSDAFFWPYHPSQNSQIGYPPSTSQVSEKRKLTTT